jgi:hypothetical protein
LLRHFERALEHMLEHRELILKEIDRITSPSDIAGSGRLCLTIVQNS